MLSKSQISSAAVLLFTLSVSPLALAQLKSKALSASPAHSSSPETKKKMADMYQKMADCMKSEKTQQDCHKEAVKDCRVATASGSCPMMNGTEAIMQHEKSKHGVKKHEKEHDMDQSGETH